MGEILSRLAGTKGLGGGGLEKIVLKDGWLGEMEVDGWNGEACVSACVLLAIGWKSGDDVMEVACSVGVDIPTDCSCTLGLGSMLFWMKFGMLVASGPGLSRGNKRGVLPDDKFGAIGPWPCLL